MPQFNLPASPSDVLHIPKDQVPEVVRGLLERKAMSSLMERIHGEIASGDPERVASGRQALQHLGFPVS